MFFKSINLQTIARLHTYVSSAKNQEFEFYAS
jgi:hypothetical protein